jgi:hypothetical protein
LHVLKLCFLLKPALLGALPILLKSTFG